MEVFGSEGRVDETVTVFVDIKAHVGVVGVSLTQQFEEVGSLV